MKHTLHTLLTILFFSAIAIRSFGQTTDCKPYVVYGKNTFCEGDTTSLKLGTNPFPNTEYRWFRDTSAIAGSTGQSLTVNQAGTYRLETIRREEKWTWAMEGGPDSDLNDIQFLGNTGWIVGSYGTLLKTTNGYSWDTIPTNRQDHLTAVGFVNTQIGWVGGVNGLLLKSTNGGSSWEKQGIPVSGAIQKIKFLNENTGYVLADRLLFKTTNGGANWQSVTLPNSFGLEDIAFVDADFGWIASNTQIYKTENGGGSWTLQKTVATCESYRIQKLYALDRNNCWGIYSACTGAANYATSITRTNNGGLSWTEHGIYVPANFPTLSYFTPTGIVFTDAQIGYAIGRVYKRQYAIGGGVNEGAVYKTSDGGKTWGLIYSNPFDISPFSLSFSSLSFGQIVGRGGLMMSVSSTGGVSLRHYGRSFLPLNSIAGTSSYVIVGGGRPRATIETTHPDSKSIVLTSTNGAKSWVKEEVAGRYSISQVRFKNKDIGWKVGYATMSRTTDGGATWIDLLGNLPYQAKTDIIRKAYFQSENAGFYIAGPEGYGSVSLFRFTGSTRNSVSVPYSDSGDPYTTSMLDLQFINDNVGFITTSNGKLIKTTNGGANWSVQVVRAGKSLQRCFFVNDRLGWIITNDGVILKTQNGGESWSEQNSGVSISLNGIYFLSEQVGYVVGTGGLILKTSDGGNSWVRQNTGTRNTLNDITFTDPNTGWVVGENGTILKLTVSECRSLSDPVVITIKQKPEATITPNGTTEFCEGGSVDMTANAGSNYTYQWYRNGAAFATSNQIKATQSGDYTVQVKNAEGCERTSEAKRVMVSQPPALTLIKPSETTLCRGKTLEIRVQSSTTVSRYEWYRNGQPIVNANAANLVVSESGTYEVKATSSSGCTGGSEKLVINPPYQISLLAQGDTVFCTGQNVGLRIQTNSNSLTSYQWFRNGTAIAGATINAYTASESGTYAVETMDAAGCKALSTEIRVRAKPLPAKPTISASGDMKLVSSATAGNQWYFNGTALGGATSAELSPTQAGSYTLLVTLDGCSSALSEPFEYVITATDPALTASMTIYPNPSPDQIFVALKNISGPFELELINSEGRLLATHRVTSPSQESILPLELKGLAPGTYIVRIRSGTFTKSSKVILNR